MKILENKRGLSTVEFVIAFSFLIVCFLLILEVFFFAFSGEIATYALYMGGRSEYVHGDSVMAIRSVSSWISPDNIKRNIYKKDGILYSQLRVESKSPSILSSQTPFSIINNKLKIGLIGRFPIDVPVAKDCEDNPLLWGLEVLPCF